MKTAITTIDPAALARMNDIMHQAGQAANDTAARHAFADHTARKSNNTIRRKMTDLALFETFLQSAGIPAAGLFDNPHARRGITWRLVEGFIKWQLLQGCAVESVNVRLSTVKTYAQLALKAGALDVREYAMIQTAKGYSHKEQHKIDAGRKAAGMGARQPESGRAGKAVFDIRRL